MVTGVSGIEYAVARYTPGGVLDTNFDGDGRVTTSIGGISDIGHGVAIDSNGKILVGGGSVIAGAGSDFSAARYNSDGSLDSTFSGDGVATFAIGSSSDVVYGAALDANDRLTLTGYAHTGSNLDIASIRIDATGLLDSGFGSGGVVTTAVGTGNDFAKGVALDASGRMYVAGHSDLGVGDDYVLIRYLGNGTLDNNFGSGGIVTTNVGVSQDRSYAAMVQPDGKIVSVGLAYTGLVQDGGTGQNFALTRHNPDGSLDPAFGTFGQASIDILSDDNAAYAITTQPDGKFLVAGYTVPAFAAGADYDFAVLRYNVDGTLDTTCGGDGIVTTDFGSNGRDTASAVAIQPDGKTIAAGLTDSGGDADFALARDNLDGSLDATFGSGGLVSFDFDSSNDGANRIELQPDGNILVSGNSFLGNSNIGLARLTPGGGLDNSFGVGGRQSYSFNVRSDFSHDYAHGLALQPDGAIVVTGFSTDGDGDDSFAIARFLGASDSLVDDSDTAIGTITDNDVPTLTIDVAATSISEAAGAAATTVTITRNTDTTGPLTVTLSTDDTSEATVPDTVVIPAGEASATFPVDAVDDAIVDGTQTVSVTASATQHADGSDTLDVTDDDTTSLFVVTADAIIPENGSTTVTVSLSTPTTTDTLVTLSVDDTTEASVSPTSVTIPAFQTSASTVITVSGVTDGLVDGNQTVVLTAVTDRVSAVFDVTFDGDGYAPAPFQNASTGAEAAIAVQPDGKVVVAGSYSARQWRVVRYLPNGSIDPTFGSGGVVTTQLTSTDSYPSPRSVAIQPNGRILVGGKNNVGTGGGFIVRYDATGSADTTFGTSGNGIIVDNSAWIQDIDLRDDGYILLSKSANGSVTLRTSLLTPTGASAGSLSTGTGVSIDANASVFLADNSVVVGGSGAVAKLLPGGGLDTSFGTNGVVQLDLQGESVAVRDVQLDDSGRIVIAADRRKLVGNSTRHDFGLIRLMVDGSYDPSFGVAGGVFTDLGAAYSHNSRAVVLQNDGKIVQAGASYESQIDRIPTVLRFNSDGTPDNSFFGGGSQQGMPDPTTSGIVFDLDVQPDGRVVGVTMFGTLPGAFRLSDTPLSASAMLTVTDFDSTSLSVATTNAVISESGSTTVTVSLSTPVASDTTVSLGVDDSTEAVITPSTAVIPAGRTSATATLSGVVDNLVDGTQTVTVSVTAPGLNIATASVDVTDDDAAGFQATESGSGTVVTESGTTDTFDVVLTAQPLTNVVVTVTSADPGEATVSVGGTPVGPRRLFAVAPSENSIVELNPITGAELNRSAVPAGLASSDQGLAYDGSSLFFIDGSSSTILYELDPETGAILDSDDLPAPTVRLVEGLTAFRGRIFLLDSSKDQIHEFDPVTDTIVSSVTTSFNSGGGLGSLETDDRLLVAQVPGATAGTNLHEVDPADGSILNSLGNAALNIIRGATAFDDEIFVSSGFQGDGIRVRDRSGSTIRTLSLSYGASGLASGFGPAGTLTFTPQNWNTPQTVTVTGVDDPTVDGDQVTSLTVSINDVASDDAFDSLADQIVAATTTDNDSAGFAVSETGGTTVVSESGTTDTLSLVLTAQPLTNVTLTLTNPDPGEISLSATFVTFTPATWNVPQNIIVTGVADGIVDEDQTTLIQVSVDDAVSDDAFDGLADIDVAATTTDENAPALTLTIGADTISENGGSTTATVSRNTNTTGALTVTLSSSDTSEATVPATITIAAGATSATFAITGVDDAIVDGTQTVTVLATAASHANGADTLDVTDDDAPALTVTIDLSSISESGGAATGTVTRNTSTTDNLVVTLSSNDTSEATVPATVTIPAGQSSATFTITGVDDAIVDGTQTVEITASTSATVADS